jgi:hypothetical protein
MKTCFKFFGFFFSTLLFSYRYVIKAKPYYLIWALTEKIENILQYICNFSKFAWGFTDNTNITYLKRKKENYSIF